MTVCDLELEGNVVDKNFDENLRLMNLECDRLEDQCQQFKSASTKYSCLARYGVEKTPEYCHEFEQASAVDVYNYPLRNKFACLTNPENNFEDSGASADELNCLNKFYAFPI